ncbi:hypothetical protein Tco_1161326 [Tanacetum coccineum]
MMSIHISSGLALQRHMASIDNTSGPATQRKERCTLLYALSSKEEKSSSPAHISSGLGYQLMTPGTISSGLVPQPHSPTPNGPPTKNDGVAAQDPVASTSTPSSMIIDQDAPSTSTSQTTHEL